MSETRLAVNKTYKLFINGAFPRSESGRSYEVSTHDGIFVANCAKATRKDAREAVVAARGALKGWSSATAYNRGQVLYRVAEMTEARAEELAGHVSRSEAVTMARARRLVQESIDRIVWYAGWTDKLAQVFGSANPVAGPFFNFSVPQPTGVVAVVCPQESSLLGCVSTLIPPLVVGNTVVAVASVTRPLPAILLGEIMATSDVPAGVCNILTGLTAEIVPTLASHDDVDAIDLAGAGELGHDAAISATESIKRIQKTPEKEPDWMSDPGTQRLRAVIETTTVWHTVGQ